MRIRQIALVATDLATVRGQLFELLGLDEGFVDEGVGQFGLQNTVCTIGNSFLEVVSPVNEDTTAGRLLQRRGGDGGYMVIVQVQEPAAAAERWALAYDTVVESRDGCPIITMEDTEVRFVPIADGRGEGLQAIDLRTTDLALILERAKRLDLPVNGDSVTVCGTVLNFHE